MKLVTWIIVFVVLAALAVVGGHELGNFLVPDRAFAQTSPNPSSIAADIGKTKITWGWNQGTDGPVDQFNLKCGPSSGNYTKTTTIKDPKIREFPVHQAISGMGTWFCTVSASNEFGESANGPEVSFRAGAKPSAPVNTGLLSS
jgi:hypothetical protein